MDLNARVDKFFSGQSKFSNSHCDLITVKMFFINMIKAQLILHIKFQPNIPSHSGENGDFIIFANFSTGSHLEFRPYLILLF